MLIVGSIVAIELAVIIWLLIAILHELEEIEHRKPPKPKPYPHTCL